MKTAVKEYYDQLATAYDEDRFGNSYGQYIDEQEKKIVRSLVHSIPKEKILDIGCGTGRFLEFAQYGIDISPEMIKIAQAKYPDKQLSVSSATELPFDNNSFKRLISFHVFMHLDKTMTAQIFQEAHRVLEKGGQFIFDIPSKSRRKITNYQAANWHGANDFTSQEMKDMLGDQWEIKKIEGIAFFPIHRIPKSVRKYFVSIDSFLSKTLLKEYASYLLFVIEKK